MMVVLVFGVTPMAMRLAFYLQAYSEQRNIPAVVRQTPVTTMEQVQDAVWKTYTSASHSGRPTVVINAHELSDLKECETNAERAWRLNTRDAAHIAYASRTADIPLIQLSSEHVFRGNSGPYPIDKEPTNPLNIYGVTKWYAEQVARKIHPYHEEEKGVRILRTSDLYGFDVMTSPPAHMTKVEKGQVETSGVVRDPTRSNPSFIGEAAFLIARNIIHNTGFTLPVAHIAPDIPITTWGAYMHDLEAQVIHQEVQWKDGDVVRVGTSRGLKPTQGWHLPQDPQKSWREFQSEYVDQKYTEYWG